MSRGYRNGWNKGEFLIIDSESGMTRYSGQVKKDYTGEMVTKRFADYEQPQDFIRPNDDPRPIPFANPGLQDFVVDTCIPTTIGETNVSYNLDTPAEHIFGICPPSAMTIQTATITISSGQATGNATINQVRTNYAVVFLNGINTTSGTDNPSSAHTRVEFASSTGGLIPVSTVVKATRGGSTANTVTAKVTIIEFPGTIVESVISGKITIPSSGTSNTAGIPSVDTTRSAVIFQGYSTTETSFGSFPPCNVILTNATTVTANTNVFGAVTVGYSVIQFADDAIQSVQPVLYDASDSNAVEIVTLTTPVTVANCITFFNGNLVNRSEMQRDGSHIVQLSNTNTVTFTSQGTLSTNKKLAATIVEFVPGVINSRQPGVTQMASAASNTTTVTSVDTSKSLLNFCNFNTSNSTAGGPSGIQPTALLTNTTTITVAKTVASTNTVNVAWELIEFA